MPYSNYTKIFTGNSIVAQRIVADLEKNNINAVVKAQTESGLSTTVFGGSNTDYEEIYVHNDELAEAVLVVENITSEPES